MIDIMGWLYKGAFSSASNSADQVSYSKNSLGFMLYPIKMIKMLLNYDINPICIFDGRPH